MYKKESVSAGGLVARQSSLSHSRALEKLPRSTETEQKKMRSQRSCARPPAAAALRDVRPRKRLNYSAAALAAT